MKKKIKKCEELYKKYKELKKETLLENNNFKAKGKLKILNFKKILKKNKVASEN
jgi:hypothetical protein